MRGLPLPERTLVPAAAAGCLLLLLAASRYGGLLFAVLLGGAAWEDSRTGYISDLWSGALAAGGAVHWVMHGTAGTLCTAAGVFLLFLALSRCHAAGGGDAPLAGAAALWLSWEAGLIFLWSACVLGGLIGAAFVLLGRKRLTDGLPFAPFLCAAGMFSYACGDAAFAVWAAL